MRYCFILIFCLCAQMSQAEIYKYQDAHGKWHFTDKQPAHIQAQSINLKPDTLVEEKIQPMFSLLEANGQWQLHVDNPFYAPIEVMVRLQNDKNKTFRSIVGANKQHIVATLERGDQRYEFQYFLGDPRAKANDFAYQLPVKNIEEFGFSQGFAGKFTHSHEPNVYAVDIPLPVGTPIYAVREGVVFEVKDTYVLDGTDEYFADKANVVKVLHDDGTLAIYAHLLAGGAKVQIGQQVNAGDLLALSGSTGFSTGPHLHFVIWRNTGMNYQSVPFKFKEGN